MSLEHLVELHTSKKHKIVHYSRKATYVFALLSLVFFGTILGYSAFSETADTLTGMVTAKETEKIMQPTHPEESSLVGFVTSVRTSPQVTEIKLFFYTAWILLVLVGSAVWYEVQEKRR